jgi:uncharacterized membrane protein YgcG
MLNDPAPHRERVWLVEAFIPFLAFFGALAVIIGRLAVPGHGLSLAGTYEAFAHIWVGMVLAGAIYDKGYRWAYLAALFVATFLKLQCSWQGNSSYGGGFSYGYWSSHFSYGSSGSFGGTCSSQG